MWTFVSKEVVIMLLGFVASALGSTGLFSTPAMITEAIIGCDNASQDGMLYGISINDDGELCRPERFEHDTVFLEATLYSQKTVRYPSGFTKAKLPIIQLVQSPPDTFVCDSKEGIEGYLSEGVGSIVGNCEPILWADVSAWQVEDKPFASEYCASMLGTLSETVDVEIYQVLVGNKQWWAITDPDCLDVHMDDRALWGPDPDEIEPTQDRPTIVASATE